ncbi:Sodium/hydrogen exchanger 9B2 [Borealophlyctis nickersoniae]|nr:Sodium/hydrogen exchanger 9B2 [Borealophlyctis nickersoniae]
MSKSFRERLGSIASSSSSTTLTSKKRLADADPTKPTTTPPSTFHRTRNTLTHRILPLIIMAGLLYTTGYLIFKSSFLPGGTLFTLFIAFVLAHVLGYIVGLAGVAPLSGMIVAGVILRNSGAVPAVPAAVAGPIRSVGVTIILCLAGLGLSTAQVRREKLGIPTLGILPFLADMISNGVAIHLIFDQPWLWTFMFAFGLAATAPAVIVPLSMWLEDRGLGRRNRAGVLMLGALPIDITLGVAGYALFQGTIFESNPTLVGFHAPLELLGGLLGSLILSYLFAILPLRLGIPASYRHVMAILASILVNVGCKTLNYSGAAYMSVIALWFTIRNTWSPEDVEVGKPHIKFVWNHIVQPLFFPGAGLALDFASIDGVLAGKALAVMLIGITFRAPVTYLVTRHAAKCSKKQSVFMSGMWTAKASIQTALASAALDRVTSSSASRDSDTQKLYVTYATQILVTYVLAVLVQSIFATIWVRATAYRLLKSDAEYEVEDREEGRIVKDGAEEESSGTEVEVAVVEEIKV